MLLLISDLLIMFTIQLIIKYKEESNILKYILNSPWIAYYGEIKVYKK